MARYLRSHPQSPFLFAVVFPSSFVTDQFALSTHSFQSRCLHSVALRGRKLPKTLNKQMLTWRSIRSSSILSRRDTTEQMLRQESANLDKDGRPIPDRAEDFGNGKYSRGFRLLINWIDQNLDIYKVISKQPRTSVPA